MVITLSGNEFNVNFNQFCAYLWRIIGPNESERHYYGYNYYSASPLWTYYYFSQLQTVQKLIHLLIPLNACNYNNCTNKTPRFIKNNLTNDNSARDDSQHSSLNKGKRNLDSRRPHPIGCRGSLRTSAATCCPWNSFYLQRQNRFHHFVLKIQTFRIYRNYF